MHRGQTTNNIRVHSKAVSGMKKIADNSDATANTVVWCSSHKHASDLGDVQAVVKDLLKLQPFDREPCRYHYSLKNDSINQLHEISDNDLHDWIMKKALSYATEVGQ